MNEREKVTCRRCAWVHLAYTKEEAAEGGWYRDTCYSCGGKDFRPYESNDAPAGATLQAVVISKETDRDAELVEAAEKLIEAYESEYESQEGPGEDDRDQPDGAGLTYRDDGDPVAVSAWFTHGHFRRLRAALQRKRD